MTPPMSHDTHTIHLVGIVNKSAEIARHSSQNHAQQHAIQRSAAQLYAPVMVMALVTMACSWYGHSSTPGYTREIHLPQRSLN